MKKSLCFFLFMAMIAIYTPSKAFLVTIPDANFRAFLQSQFSTCFVGIQMETTCVTLTYPNSFYLQGRNIASLSGIQYFSRLHILDCSNNQLTSIPTLSPTLIGLICNNNQLTSLPALPLTLTSLECNNNQLVNLPTLPPSLAGLECNNNQITNLPVLLANLTHLRCNGNQLTNLPTLPTNLIHLECIFNQLTSIPTLPINLHTLRCGNNRLTSLPSLAQSANLQYLWCQNNQLTSIPPLPAGLYSFDCNNNQLATLPTLPTVIFRLLYCANNQLTSLPTLPSSLWTLWCYNNQLTSLPVLPVLPAGAGELVCHNNQLTSLPAFPSSWRILYCEGNELDFSDLESINFRSSWYTANPQSYKILPSTQSLMARATLTINGGIGGSANVYRWYKDGWLITGANSATYTKTNITATDAGVYKCVVTSNYLGLGTTTGVTITSNDVTIGVFCPAVTVNNSYLQNGAISLSNGTAGVPYNQTLIQTGFVGTPVWSIVGGTSLPAGLFLSTTGTISGIPTYVTVPNFPNYFFIQLTDGVCTEVGAFVIIISCPSIVINNMNLSNATVGIPYHQTLTQTGLTGVPIWSVIGGLPAGLSLDTSTGVILGTPTTANAQNVFSILVTDNICMGISTFMVAVACPTTITINPRNLVNSTIGVPYNQALTQIGLIGNYTWTVVGGNLPSGLLLDATTGVISGTPTTAGVSTFTVQVIQGTCKEIKRFSINVTTGNFPQIISFAPVTVTYGDASFGLVASTNSGLPVTYSSANTAVATVSGNTFTIVGAGTTQITASQAGNSLFAPAIPVTQTFTVLKKDLIVTPQDITIEQDCDIIPPRGGTMPIQLPTSFILNYSGFVLGENISVLTTLPTATLQYMRGRGVYYLIIPASGVANNYNFIYNNGTLIIAPCPYFKMVASNPKNTFSNETNNEVVVYPNPSNGDFKVDFGGLDLGKVTTRVYDAQGKEIYLSEINNTNPLVVSLGNVASGIYLLQISTEKGNILKRVVKK